MAVAGQETQALRVTRKRLLVLLGIAMVVLSVLLYAIDPHTSNEGPTIMSFEFAGNTQRAGQIMAEWGSKGRDAARLSLWIDFGYLACYGAFFTLAGFATRDLAHGRGWRRLAAAGTAASLCAAVAAVFDASEDVALLLVLGGRGGGFATPFATACSVLKFTLIATAIVYVLAGLTWRVAHRPQPA